MNVPTMRPDLGSGSVERLKQLTEVAVQLPKIEETPKSDTDTAQVSYLEQLKAAAKYLQPPKTVFPQPWRTTARLVGAKGTHGHRTSSTLYKASPIGSPATNRQTAPMGVLVRTEPNWEDAISSDVTAELQRRTARKAEHP